MTRGKKSASAPLDYYQQGLEAFKKSEPLDALGQFKKALEQDPDDEKSLLALGRCQMATHHRQEAIQTYQTLLKKRDCSITVQIEARMVLGDSAAALTEVENALKKEPGNGRVNLLAAWLYYHHGFIVHTYHYFSRAVEAGAEWEDEDMVNDVVRHTLSTFEYQDLETIYLDVTDRISEGIAKPENRWMWLTLTISELLESKRAEHRQKCAATLIQLLMPHRSFHILKNGRDELEQIIRDFARSETDPEFGLKILDEFNQSRYDKIARLLLGLELDHLKQFAEYFGLTPDIVEESLFPTLLTLLPCYIAIDLLLLYSLSDKADAVFSRNAQSLDPRLTASLIAACLINFYSQVEKYRHNLKPPTP